VQRLAPQPGGGQTVVKEQVALEDIMAYTKFVQERAGLSDQEALATSLAKLTDRLDAVILGNAYRTHLHIRDVARRMLQSRKEPSTEQVQRAVIETLAERVYAHGHAIGLRDAEEIGLPVSAAPADLDPELWRLLNEYEQDLKLLEPIDPALVVQQSDTYTEDGVLAVIESTWGAHEFQGQVEIRARRQTPPNLTVSLNMNLQLPANINPANLPQDVQQALQQLLQQAQQGMLAQAQQAVQDALRQQAPLAGLEAAVRGGRWVKAA
jgi:hypothetical protein